MSTHPRTTRRIERIHAEIPITRVLHMYGFQVRPDIGDREQQFSCSLHGGRDTKPSARVYPATNQWYCVDTDAPVLTDRGWVRLGSVHPGVDTLLDGACEWHTPPAYFDRGTRPVVRVETTAGYEVTLTPDHQVFVVGRGWVEASQLRHGDVLDIPKPTVPKFDVSTVTFLRDTYNTHDRASLQRLQLTLLQTGVRSVLRERLLVAHEDAGVFRSITGITGYINMEPFHARVVSVTDAGMRPVADVAMPSEHSFVAGGIRVHNCWTCSKSRDAISTVREKDGIDFHAAIAKLESLFNLPPLPWEDGDTEPKPVDIFATPQTTDADRLERVGKILYGLTKERALPFDTTINLWERYDRLASLADTSDLVDEIAELRDDILRIVKSCTSST